MKTYYYVIIFLIINCLNFAIIKPFDARELQSCAERVAQISLNEHYAQTPVGFVCEVALNLLDRECRKQAIKLHPDIHGEENGIKMAQFNADRDKMKKIIQDVTQSRIMKFSPPPPLHESLPEALINLMTENTQARQKIALAPALKEARDFVEFNCRLLREIPEDTGVRPTPVEDGNFCLTLKEEYIINTIPSLAEALKNKNLDAVRFNPRYKLDGLDVFLSEDKTQLKALTNFSQYYSLLKKAKAIKTIDTTLFCSDLFSKREKSALKLPKELYKTLRPELANLYNIVLTDLIKLQKSVYKDKGTKGKIIVEESDPIKTYRAIQTTNPLLHHIIGVQETLAVGPSVKLVETGDYNILIKDIASEALRHYDTLKDKINITPQEKRGVELYKAFVETELTTL